MGVGFTRPLPVGVIPIKRALSLSCMYLSGCHSQSARCTGLAYLRHHRHRTTAIDHRAIINHGTQFEATNSPTCPLNTEVPRRLKSLPDRDPPLHATARPANLRQDYRHGARWCSNGRKIDQRHTTASFAHASARTSPSRSARKNHNQNDRRHHWHRVRVCHLLHQNAHGKTHQRTDIRR